MDRITFLFSLYIKLQLSLFWTVMVREFTQNTTEINGKTRKNKTSLRKSCLKRHQELTVSWTRCQQFFIFEGFSAPIYSFFCLCIIQWLGEILMLNNCIVIFRNSPDVIVYVIGSADENELILNSVMNGFYDALYRLTRY